MNINPEYLDALFQLVLIDDNGEEYTTNNELRFTEKTLERALELMDGLNYTQLQELSVPKYLTE